MKKKIPIPLQGSLNGAKNKISSFHLKLKENQDNLNDLIQYQKTSSKKSFQACTGKWLAKILFKNFSNQIKLLDVGALDGSTWDKFKDKIQVESIDLNPLSSKVKRQDFFKRPFGECFQVVSLSLVLNFVQNPFKRGEMLIRAVKFLKEKGILYITLPKS